MIVRDKRTTKATVQLLNLRGITNDEVGPRVDNGIDIVQNHLVINLNAHGHQPETLNDRC